MDKIHVKLKKDISHAQEIVQRLITTVWQSLESLLGFRRQNFLSNTIRKVVFNFYATNRVPTDFAKHFVHDFSMNVS